jgi:hypothetical protein
VTQMKERDLKFHETMCGVNRWFGYYLRLAETNRSNPPSELAPIAVKIESASTLAWNAAPFPKIHLGMYQIRHLKQVAADHVHH